MIKTIFAMILHDAVIRSCPKYILHNVAVVFQQNLLEDHYMSLSFANQSNHMINPMTSLQSLYGDINIFYGCKVWIEKCIPILFRAHLMIYNV